VTKGITWGWGAQRCHSLSTQRARPLPAGMAPGKGITLILPHPNPLQQVERGLASSEKRLLRDFVPRNDMMGQSGRESPSPESSPIKGEEIASARGIGPRNDMRVEGEDSSPCVSQLRVFLITSVRLSLVTRSVLTSGRRLISPVKGWRLSIVQNSNLPSASQYMTIPQAHNDGR